MPPIVNSARSPDADALLADSQWRRRRSGLPSLTIALAFSSLLAAVGASAWWLQAPAPAPDAPMATATAAMPMAMPAPAPLNTQDEVPTQSPLFVAAGDDPEGRLIQAYTALASGDGRKAMDLTEQLLKAHPGFHLAHLLRGDLLAARSGLPRAFAGAATDATQGQRADIADLRTQALRRLEALRERPPAGHLPREMVDLPAHVKHAVAVDTERSRLFLFRNGPNGMTLERDFFVSLGKQGIGKQVEGDARTPLGVYWITNALPSNMLDERFGRAALGINYPNALDRHLGRTGTGLFLHGVPAQVYSHSLWATDGCVALANDDVELLLKRLEVADTPVIISKRLQWVAPDQTKQAALEFRQAYQAWDEARRSGDNAALNRWYETAEAIPPAASLNTAERGSVSLLAWYGDAQPVMVVTSREQGTTAKAPAIVHRQYWVQTQGQWRIRFDGPVPPMRNPSYARR